LRNLAKESSTQPGHRQPIFTVVFAILLLHNTLRLIQITGGIIAIAGGVIAVSGDAFPKRPTEVPGKNRPGRLAKTLL